MSRRPGKGERFGGGKGERKTFAKLDGKPLFIQTLQHFVNREDVCQTILAVAPEDIDKMKTSFGPNLGFMGVKLVEGGDRRCETVARALSEVGEEAEFVAVQDAARPCVTEDMINRVFAEAVKSGAAILASPITVTVKRVSEANLIEETVSRAGFFEAQTPQVFRKELLVAAYERLGETDDDVTDDAQLVELAGNPVSVVLSDASNLKITRKADLGLAKAIIKARPAKALPRLGLFEEAQW